MTTPNGASAQLQAEPRPQRLPSTSTVASPPRQVMGLLNAVFPDVLWVYNIDADRTEFLSSAFERVWGRPAADVLKDPDAWMQSVHPDDIAAVEAALGESERTGVYRATYRVIHKDGTVRTVVDEGHRVTASDGCRYILGLARDLGRSMAIERRLSRAEHLRGLAQLCGGLAHDYNNILASVSATVQAAAAQLSDGGAAERLLRSVRADVERAAELTGRLAAVAGKGAFSFETVDIADAFPMLAATAQSIAPRLDVKDPVDVAGLMVDIDRRQFRQLLANLVKNAAEASFNRTSDPVVVRLSRDTICDPTTKVVDLGILHRGSYAVVDVEDHGIGMSPEIRARLFEPYFSTKFAGRGLGLAAVSAIVLAHDGALRVETRPGRGTKVRIWIPSSLREGGACDGKPSGLVHSAESCPLSMPDFDCRNGRATCGRPDSSANSR